MPNNFGTLRPSEIEFDPKSQTLKSQGREGSCVMQSITNALEYGYYHWLDLQLDINVDIVYHWSTEFFGYRYNFSSAEKCMKAFQDKFGGIPAIDRKTGKKCITRIKEVRGANERIDTEDEKYRFLRRSLQRGIGFICAFRISESTFKNFEIDGTGVLVFDKAEPSRSAHAVAVVGFTDEYIILGNSWGEQWGTEKNGTFKVLRSDIDELFNDLSMVYIDKTETLVSLHSEARFNLLNKGIEEEFFQSKFQAELVNFL